MKSLISLKVLLNDIMKFLKDVCYIIIFYIICFFGFFFNVYSKYENFWSYSRYFVIEIVFVNIIYMGSKCVFFI